MIFISDKCPIIFKLYERQQISVHSLIAFNLSFDIYNKMNIDSLNIVEKERLKKIDNVLKKYYKLIESYYDNVNWKTFLYELMKGGL